VSRFRGRYDYSIDEKGRLNIPAKFRKCLSTEAEDTFVICRAPDNCLWAYPLDAWEEYEDQLDKMALTKETNMLLRKIQNSLADSQLDKQGRITIAPAQLSVAGISKSVTIIGRGKYLELWDTAAFEKYTGEEDNFDEIFYRAHNQENLK